MTDSAAAVNDKYGQIIYSPSRSSASTAQYLQERIKNKAFAVPLGIRSLDDRFLPMVRGEVCAVVGRPGNGKTGFMVAWARRRSAWLRENGFENRAVVYVTLEQTVQELTAFSIAADARKSISDMARGNITEAEWAECMRAAVTRSTLPMWLVGYSAMPEDSCSLRIDVPAVFGALEAIQAQGRVIDLVLVDYLQRFPMRASEKTIDVMNNIESLKNMALQRHCPVVVGVQASREVDDLSVPVPQPQHCQWSSGIEQTADKIISLMRPSKYFEDGEAFGKYVTRGKNQILITVLKQKLGDSNFSQMAFFEPAFNRLDDLEEERSK